jgi:hypothetical protein
VYDYQDPACIALSGTSITENILFAAPSIYVENPSGIDHLYLLDNTYIESFPSSTVGLDPLTRDLRPPVPPAAASLPAQAY